MKEGKKPEYPEKTPSDELHKMPHATTRRFKPKARLEPVQQHWWRARKADMLTVTPCVAPVYSVNDPQLATPGLREEKKVNMMSSSAYVLSFHFLAKSATLLNFFH